MIYKKYLAVLFFLVLYFLSFTQDKLPSKMIIEGYYALNQNAYSNDAIAQAFLDKGLGTNIGFSGSQLMSTKKAKLWEVYFAAGFLDYSVSPSNLKYEFDFIYDEDCCLRMPSALYMISLGGNYLIEYIKAEKFKAFVGLGVGVNIDISTTKGTYRVGNRFYWDATDKPLPVVLPTVNVSSRFIYSFTDNFALTSKLNFQNAPLNDLDFNYYINSRDGIFEGEFHQRILALQLSIGVVVNP